MIQPLASGDREAFVNLLRDTHTFSAVEIAIAMELVDIVLARGDQKDYHAFVDRLPGPANGHITGLLVLGPVPATVGAWHLYWIAVHPSYQGTGAAQALALFAESYVCERGGYWLLAETSSHVNYQRARAFYTSHGYVPLAHISDYYRPSEDMILVGKRLVP